MGIYLGSTELGGGGGAAIGDYALKPAAAGANTYTDSNGHVWLKTGVVETTLSTYPEAPLTRALSFSSPEWTSHFNGGYALIGIEHDSLNNIPVIRSGSYWSVYQKAHTADKDSNGDYDGTFTGLANPTAGGSMFQSTPLSDGTDHWIAMYDGTASAHTGPRYSTFSTGNTFGANNIVFKKATGGTYNAYTTTDTGKISTSGYTGRLTADWSGTSNESGHVISSIGITDDHFYVGAFGYDTSTYTASTYAVYYYQPTYVQQFYTIKYNKSDGSFAGVILDKLPINDSSSNKVFLIEAPKTYPATTQLVEHVNTDGTIGISFYVTKGGSGNRALLEKMWSDNNGDFYVINSSGSYPGTIDKYVTARGISQSLYARGMTVDTSRVQTGSNSGTDVGPFQTSELKGEQLYIRVL